MSLCVFRYVIVLPNVTLLHVHHVKLSLKLTLINYTVMMEESKLTNFQRRQLNDKLTSKHILLAMCN